MRYRDARVVGSEIHCEMEGHGPCVLSVWSPRIEDSGLASVKLLSDSRVVLTSYRTPQAFYVQSFEPKNRALFDTLLQDVAEYASTGEYQCDRNKNSSIWVVVYLIIQPSQIKIYRI